MSTLYAWASATPFPDSPVDHTWVTDYDNRVAAPYPNIAAVIAAGANYWFCWGDFHKKGTSTQVPKGFLGSKGGSVPWASCLCAPNAPSKSNRRTCGTIYYYGIDGVCHQLANQVLWSTGGGTRPLTVSKARGYRLSTFLYGTYGLQHDAWAARKVECAPPGVAGKARRGVKGGGMGKPRPDDEFAAHARAVLRKHKAEHKLPAVLALRALSHTVSAAHKAGVQKRKAAPTAAALNAQHRAHLEEAGRLLTKAEFKELFGISTAQIKDVQLVDPKIYRRSRPGK
jgi:hypothetical protein